MKSWNKVSIIYALQVKTYPSETNYSLQEANVKKGNLGRIFKKMFMSQYCRSLNHRKAKYRFSTRDQF